MALDATLKKQLLDARDKIIAQLNETRFPSTPRWRGGGGPVHDYAYDELQKELREIDELLGFEEDDQDCGSTEVPLPSTFSQDRQPKRSKFLAVAILAASLLSLALFLLSALFTS
jgi:hypothetical protein